MKLKFAVALAVLFCSSTSWADSGQTVIDVTASICYACYPGDSTAGSNALSSLAMNAQFTLQEMTGQFVYPPYGDVLIDGTLDEVMSITGTLNGYSIGLAESPYGGQSWLYPDGSLGAFFFVLSDGQTGDAFFDGYNELELFDANGDGYGTSTRIYFGGAGASPVNSPEPSSLLLTGMGLAALIGLCGEKHLRKRSA
jgi:hypothetical protein